MLRRPYPFGEVSDEAAGVYRGAGRRIVDHASCRPDSRPARVGLLSLHGAGQEREGRIGAYVIIPALEALNYNGRTSCCMSRMRTATGRACAPSRTSSCRRESTS